MKTTLNRITIKNALCLLILLCIFYTNAQVKTDFVPRYSTTVKGSFSVIANNVLSRHATNDFNSNDIDENNNDDESVYVDIDNDLDTFNSSSADYLSPDNSLADECFTIKKAFLYWAGSDLEANGGVNVPDPIIDNQPNWNYDDIKLMLPGQTTYSTLTADATIYRGRDEHFSNDPYICVKDITSLVTANAVIFGTYQVANVETKVGSLHSHSGPITGVSGGWQIVFVYESPTVVTKKVTIFDGYAHITTGANDVNFDFSGLQTIPSGPVNADILMGALEGDRSYNGSVLEIEDVGGSFVALSTNERDSDNFF